MYIYICIIFFARQTGKEAIKNNLFPTCFGHTSFFRERNFTSEL